MVINKTKKVIEEEKKEIKCIAYVPTTLTLAPPLCIFSKCHALLNGTVWTCVRNIYLLTTPGL